MLDALHFTIIKSPLLFTIIAIVLGALIMGICESLDEIVYNEDAGIVIPILLAFMVAFGSIVYCGIFYEPSYF
ncbi:hypothetical protein VH12019_00075 [Vibrio phage VH1_2019]|uniref:Uncharacterized protein n=1 Tax=Vibrio phage VH1_2019 TaxID=2686307 RepID=A0A6B9SYZ5_9CAUD|nr:hypothetical protein VH12019_00075 [Vibrio phage VH1_2019]